MLIEGIDFIHILFELTIFFLLSIFVYKIFVDYVLPSLYGEIEEIKKHEDEWQDKDKLLNSSKISLQKTIKEQEDDLFVLDKKLQLWKETINQKTEETNIRNDLLLQTIKKNRKIQETNLKVSKTEKLVIPQAVKLAYQEIENLYSGKKGESLLKELITKIEPEQ